jgi:hypothetical protein
MPMFDPVSWAPTPVSGDEFEPRESLWGHALQLTVSRLLLLLGILTLISADLLAEHTRRPIISIYVSGLALSLLGGGWWLLLVWYKPEPVRLVLGADRLQLHQGVADVLDEVPYHLIESATLIRFPKMAGGGYRGLGLRLRDLRHYLSAWPQHTARCERDRQETGYEWVFSSPSMPWPAILDRLKEKQPALVRRDPISI